jgi:four helix bundle protein
MEQATGNVVRDKSFVFAVRAVRLVQHLRNTHGEYVLSRQFLKAGTSIGANVEEALAGQSRKDFTAKMAIASKEAREAAYWLRLLRETGYLGAAQADSIESDCQELVRLLTSIVKTSQER